MEIKEFIEHAKWCLDKAIQPSIANCQLTIEQQEEAISIIETQLAALAEKDIEVDSFRDGIIDANEQIAALKDELAGYVILKEDYAQASALLVAAREQIAELKTEIEQMKEHTWCAYCGLEIHIDDEAATKISEHIMTCEKHPIHIALAENSRQAEEIERLKAELLTVHEILACPGEHRNGSLPEQPMTVRRLLDLIYVWHKNNERLDRYESDIRISEAALGLSGLYATKDKEIDDLKAERNKYRDRKNKLTHAYAASDFGTFKTTVSPTCKLHIKSESEVKG